MTLCPSVVDGKKVILSIQSGSEYRKNDAAGLWKCSSPPPPRRKLGLVASDLNALQGKAGRNICLLLDNTFFLLSEKLLS